MASVHNIMLESLQKANNKLSTEANSLVRKFIKSCHHHDGGFNDKAGKPDPYYSVFGYSLALLFEIDLDYEKEQSFLNSWPENNSVDLVHAVSLVRCKLLLEAIRFFNKNPKIQKMFSNSDFLKDLVISRMNNKIVNENRQLIDIIEKYKSKDKGYNQNGKGEENSTVYASFLVWSLYADLEIKIENKTIFEGIEKLRLQNGAYANETNSPSGVTTATSAGLIMEYLIKNSVNESSVEWLKIQQTKPGGFIAAENVPIADLLSTATALLALSCTNNFESIEKEKVLNFINLHWDNTGGFFGSVADLKPDCEYTFYALLTLGLL